MRCLVLQEGESFTAVLLEHLVGAQGTSPAQAIERLQHVLGVHAELTERNGHPPVSSFEPAPEDWQALWEKSQPIPGITDERIAAARLHAA